MYLEVAVQIGIIKHLVIISSSHLHLVSQTLFAQHDFGRWRPVHVLFVRMRPF